VIGPAALEVVQRVAVQQMDVAVGRVVYTPVLGPAGGIKADLTIMRLGRNHFRVVTGGMSGNIDRKWFSDNIPDGADAHVVDQTTAYTTIGVWGPRARDILASVTEADLSHEAFGFSTCRTIEIGSQQVLASRISYVGELGWELYVSFEQGAQLWQTLLAAGEPHGMVPVGIGVYGTTGRLEKGYRAHGAELDLERSLVEAGMARKTVKDEDFVGKDAYLKQRGDDPVTILCTLTVDDHTSADGTKRYMLGREPILTADGGFIEDAHGRRSYVTSAGSAPSLGKHLLMTYLPPQYAAVGTALRVEYFGEQYPVTVAVAGATPLFDSSNDRIRG